MNGKTCETGTEKEHFDYIELLSLPLAIPEYKILLSLQAEKKCFKKPEIHIERKTRFYFYFKIKQELESCSIQWEISSSLLKD